MIKIYSHSQVKYERGLDMFFGTGRLKFLFIYFGILSKVCPQGSPYKGKTWGRRQNDNKVVVTCTVSLSSRWEVNKLQPIGQSSPVTSFINQVCWNTAMLIYLPTVYAFSCTTTAKLNSYNKDSMAYKIKNIYFLALCWKILLTHVLNF